MARSQSDNVVVDSKVTIESGFQCMSEVEEDGKLFHFLYNPTEKNTLKAWKKSEACVK